MCLIPEVSDDSDTASLLVRPCYSVSIYTSLISFSPVLKKKCTRGLKPFLTPQWTSLSLMSHTLPTTHPVLPWQSTSSSPPSPLASPWLLHSVLPWQCVHGIKKKKKKSVKMEREAAEICGAEWFVSVLKRYSGFSIVVPESCESHLSLHFP